MILSGGGNISAIGFIGAGKCGMSLAYYFRSKGIKISGFSSRRNNTEDFTFFSCEEIVSKSDVIFITVTDTLILQIWNEIRHMDLTDKIICHCSGSVSSEIFMGANPKMICSVHPMLAFNCRHTSLQAVSEAFFTIEGGKRAIDTVSEILSICGNRFKVIKSENKAKYHAASCFASNFVVSVCYEAEKLLEECGFEHEEACGALKALMKRNMDNIINYGCEKAITGPAARGDKITIERHMQTLSESEKQLYQCLTDVIYKMTERNK